MDICHKMDKSIFAGIVLCKELCFAMFPIDRDGSLVAVALLKKEEEHVCGRLM